MLGLFTVCEVPSYHAIALLVHLAITDIQGRRFDTTAPCRKPRTARHVAAPRPAHAAGIVIGEGQKLNCHLSEQEQQEQRQRRRRQSGARCLLAPRRPLLGLQDRLDLQAFRSIKASTSRSAQAVAPEGAGMPVFKGCAAHDHDCGEHDCSSAWSLYKHIDVQHVGHGNGREVGGSVGDLAAGQLAAVALLDRANASCCSSAVATCGCCFQVRCLNEAVDGSCRKVFKPWHRRLEPAGAGGEQLGARR